MLSLLATITVVSTSPTKSKNKTNPSLLKPFSKSRNLEEALLVIQSPPSGSNPNAHLQAYSLLLHTCITTRSLNLGKAIHAQLLSRPHLLQDPTLNSKLITLYSLCSQISDARSVFDLSSNDNVRSVWVAMLIACSTNCLFHEALLLYAEMGIHVMGPSGNFAFSAALKACSDLSDLRFGRGVHAQIVKMDRNEADQVVNNGLLRLYAECGSIDDAQRLFDGIPERNIVSWNTLLDGFAHRYRLGAFFDLFRKMQSHHVGFSWLTLTTVLSVCSKVSALRSGKEVHAQIVKSRQKPDISLQNSLMDMYAKSGALELSLGVFNKMVGRDLTSWNVMIMGYAINGYPHEALKLFNEMVIEGFRPDWITFIALLSSCSHTGSTAEGCRLFDRMERDFSIKPMVEHYACLVDLLGRSGHIEEALDVVENMPMSPTGSVWGSLLNSCRLYNNIELGEIVAMRLFSLEPNNAANYVMLSNMYAKSGRWEDMKKVRVMMEKRGIKKEVGSSWIQIGNKVHSFVAGGATGFRSSAEYKRVWKELAAAMEEAGYVPDTGVVLHDVDDEMKAIWVCEHSERLAVVFGLIHTGAGMPLRITKNLRVCVDCHAVMKIISNVTKRVIVLRDTNRFHHFRDGSCSCQDYW